MSEGWDALEARRQRDADRRASEQDRAEISEMAALCRDVLGTPDGRKLLAGLRRRTKDAVLGPGASERALWFREGQRQLVDQLERALAAGLRIDVEALRDDLTKG